MKIHHTLLLSWAPETMKFEISRVFLPSRYSQASSESVRRKDVRAILECYVWEKNGSQNVKIKLQDDMCLRKKIKQPIIIPLVQPG